MTEQELKTYICSMTDDELKIQISLGLIKPLNISPSDIWGLQDPELIDKLAHLYFENAIDTRNNLIVEADINAMIDNFINNPNTSIETRGYLNGMILKLRKLLR